MVTVMGVVKKVFRYSVGMAIAGIAGYEIARMQCKTPGAREESMSMQRRESMGYTPREEMSDPRDYRSIYHL